MFGVDIELLVAEAQQLSLYPCSRMTLVSYLINSRLVCLVKTSRAIVQELLEVDRGPTRVARCTENISLAAKNHMECTFQLYYVGVSKVLSHTRQVTFQATVIDTRIYS